MRQNYWTSLSIDLANQRDYLDQLFKVYPLIPEVIREIDEEKWSKVEAAFNSRDNINLMKSLLTLALFPIKDSYISYFRKDPSSIDRNPATVNRLVARLYEMGLDEIWRRASEPKETNRQMGQLFRNWAHSGALGVPALPEDDFIRADQNCILKGSDDSLKKFAAQHLNYNSSKGLDLVAKFNGKYVIGEAKFLTDYGGHQDRQRDDAMSVFNTSANAIKVAILDGVIYIPRQNSMHRSLFESADNCVLSSLLLRDFLFQV